MCNKQFFDNVVRLCCVCFFLFIRFSKKKTSNVYKKKREEEEGVERRMFLTSGNEEDHRDLKAGDLTNGLRDDSLDNVRMRLFVTYCMALNDANVARKDALDDILFKGSNVTCENSDSVFKSLYEKTKKFKEDNRYGKTHMKLYDAFVTLFFKLIYVQSCEPKTGGYLSRSMNDCLSNSKKNAITFNESNVSFRFNDVSNDGDDFGNLCETKTELCLKCNFTGDVKSRIPDLIATYRRMYYEFLNDCYAYFSKMMTTDDVDDRSFDTLGMTGAISFCRNNGNAGVVFKEVVYCFDFIKRTFQNKKRISSVGFFDDGDYGWTVYFSNTLNILFADLVFLDLNSCSTVSYKTDDRHFKYTANISSTDSVSCNCRLFAKTPKHHETMVRTDNRRYLENDARPYYGRTRVEGFRNDDTADGPSYKSFSNDRPFGCGVFVNATHDSSQTYAFTSVFFLNAKKYDETGVDSSLRFEASMKAALERYHRFHSGCKNAIVVNFHRDRDRDRKNRKDLKVFFKMVAFLSCATIFAYLFF